MFKQFHNMGSILLCWTWVYMTRCAACVEHWPGTSVTTLPPQKEMWRTAWHPLWRNSQQRSAPCLEELHQRPAPRTPRGGSMQRLCVLSSTAPSFRSVWWVLLVISHEFVAFAFIHTCTSISDSTVVSRRGGEGAIFPSLSVRGLQLCAAGILSLHRPHCLCPTLCSGRCCGPVAQPHLLQ